MKPAAANIFGPGELGTAGGAAVGDDARVGLDDALLVARLVEALQQLLVERAIGGGHALELLQLDVGGAILARSGSSARRAAPRSTLTRVAATRTSFSSVRVTPLDLVADAGRDLGLLVLSWTIRGWRSP